MLNFIELKTNPVITNGLTKIIAGLIGSFSSVAVGIIVFTLVLKALTFVLDYFSRASMRKNSLIMKDMRPELERLQKQFQNNSQLYQQKVNSLYKKVGYSPLGSCLPTIVTLVVFIVVFSSFNDYSTIENQKAVYDMASSYNEVLIEGLDIDNDVLTVGYDAKGVHKVLILDGEKVYGKTAGDTVALSNGKTLYVDAVDDSGNYTVHTTDSYVSAVFNVTENEGVYTSSMAKNQFRVRKEGLSALKLGEETYEEYKGRVTGSEENVAVAFITEVQAEKAAETFRQNKQGVSLTFTKNIWKPDACYAFQAAGCDCANLVYRVNSLTDNTYVAAVLTDKEDYEDITLKLSTEKGELNGYYILVVLTILSSLLTQFISMRSTKDQAELQTVDGQGMQTQKMMMWMMPILMAYFAFVYTAAFSLYIITNTLLTTLTTILINKIVDKNFEKKKNKATQNIVRRG